MNPDLLRCRPILYHLSHQGGPKEKKIPKKKKKKKKKKITIMSLYLEKTDSFTLFKVLFM